MVQTIENCPKQQQPDIPAYHQVIMDATADHLTQLEAVQLPSSRPCDHSCCNSADCSVCPRARASASDIDIRTSADA